MRSGRSDRVGGGARRHPFAVVPLVVGCRRPRWRCWAAPRQARAIGSARRRSDPSAPMTSNLYRVPDADAGRRSRTRRPDAPGGSSGSTRPSHEFQSPTTRTARAFGAHTAKLAPSTPSTVRRWAPSTSQRRRWRPSPMRCRSTGPSNCAMASNLRAGCAPQHPQRPGRRRPRRTGPTPEPAGRSHSYGGRPPSAGSGNTSWMASRPPGRHVRRPALVVVAGRLHAVAAVDEHERRRRRPVPGDDRRRTDDRHHDVLQPGVVDGAPEHRQRVHPAGVAGRRATGRGAPSPPGSPPSRGGGRRRTARCRRRGRRRQPHRGAPAVGADLDERRAGHDRRQRPSAAAWRASPSSGGMNPIAASARLPQPFVHACGRYAPPPSRDDRRVTAALDDLVRLLDLEPIEVNIFRGRSPDESRQRVFGGQVAGQALVAAARTVDARPPGALAARLLPAPRRPDRARSSTRSTGSATAGASPPAASSPSSTAGRSSTCRPVFHVHEDGPRPPGRRCRRRARPRVAARLQGSAWTPYTEPLGDWYDRPRPIDIRYVDGDPLDRQRAAPPRQRVWLRADGALPDDPVLHACVVTYASDMTLLDTTAAAPRRRLGRRPRCRWPASTTPCGSTARSAPTSGCSTTRTTPSTSGARGLARGLDLHPGRHAGRHRWCRRA